MYCVFPQNHYIKSSHYRKMKLIAQILALYFLLGSLLPGSDFSQLKKAHSVWEHYQLHQKLATGSGDEVSLIGFLYDHFLNPDSHQHEDGGKSHQDLPLKTVHVFSPILPANGKPFVLSSTPAFCSQAILYYQPVSGSTHEGAIFRPPILS